MIFAVSVLFLYLCGLGLLATLPGNTLGREMLTRERFPAFAGLVLVSGLHLDYLLQLLLAGVRPALVAGTVLCIAGLVVGGFSLRGRFGRTGAAPIAKGSGGGGLGAAKWLAFGVLFVMFAVPIVQEPISAWDARSIWFFHGKIIYFGGALDRAGFTRAAIGFSHPDYPKFVPVLSAQLASFAGSWDDFLPKASLLALLLPALLGLFSFLQGAGVSFILLAGLFLFGIREELLWNGLMDGYLALYAGLALLFLGRWLHRGARDDAWCAAAFLGVVLNLKNEGMVYAAAAAFVFFGMTWAHDRALHRLRPLFADRQVWVQGLLPFSCFLVWALKRMNWGLGNDLDLGMRSLDRIAAHLEGGAFGTIAKALVVDSPLWKALFLFIAVAAGARVVKVRVPFQAWIFLAVSLCYFLAVFAVYLATPADLAWHLETSASRTVLPVLLGVFAAVYVVLERIEASPASGAGGKT